VAAAYGIPSNAVGVPDGVEAAVAWLLAEPGPALLEVMVSQETNAYPKLAFGRPITEMEPFATPVGMEGT
jgi:acetolactate synthase-1/2/3 large subunit